jgi:secondary thiamine-phosphate synthase enzyme
MIVHNLKIRLQTKGFCDCTNITPELDQCLLESAVQDGLLTVINPGSTGAVTTIEYETGAVQDLKKAIERLVPQDAHYEHNLRWGDGNGFSHVRSALMRPSLSVPIVSGALCLGTWQQVVFLDFDNRARNRNLVVQIIGK